MNKTFALESIINKILLSGVSYRSGFRDTRYTSGKSYYLN